MRFVDHGCRRFPRIAANFRVRYDVAGKTVWGRCTNVSVGGLFVRTRHLLPENAIIALHIEAHEIGAIARVARMSSRPTGIGFEFLDVASEDLVRLGLSGLRVAAPAKALTIAVCARDLTAPLAARGDHVRTSRSSVEALAMCLEQRPDVLVCDSLALLRTIRSHPSLRSLPVVLVIGTGERLRGFRSGADTVVARPLDGETLALAVDGAVARAGETRDLRGSLAHIPLHRLLALLAHERRSGDLLLVGQRAARIHLRQGRPVRIERALRRWKSGRFEFAPCLCHR